MAGQASQETRDQVRSCIRSVEKNSSSKSGSTPKMPMKTTSKQ